MYEQFLCEFDEKLAKYFERDSAGIKCQKGCTLCCENGDYPLSLLEMKYLMKGFLKLDAERHKKVRAKILSAKNENVKPYPCPFLLNGECTIYEYRPLVCRIHGLAYMKSDGLVNLPECVRQGLNYSENFDGETINFEPIREDLNLDKIFEAHPELEFGEIRSLIDWF